MSLSAATGKYTGTCACGKAYSNNCAHYLSDALIKGGYSELDGGKGADMRIVHGRCVCTAGRPIRAKELRAWAAGKFKKQSNADTAATFVYQERQSDGQGHVLIKNGSSVSGTGDFPTWKQEFFR